jgi:hypothetical protein
MEYIPITPEQQQAYQNAPNTCPFCGSDDITAGHMDSGDTEAWRDVQCNNKECRMTWTEIFDLTRIDNAFKSE